MATYYWVGGTGNWNDNRWATSSGGSPSGNIPQAGDNVVFDANSDTGTDFTVTTQSTPSAKCLSITATGPDKMCTINAGNNLTISGSVYGSSNFRVYGFVTLTPASAQALDLKGQPFANPKLSPTTTGAGYTLLSNILCGSFELYLNSPTLSLNGYQMTVESGFSVTTGTFTCDGTLVVSNPSACTISFGASTSGIGTLRFTGSALAQAYVGNAPNVTVEVTGASPVSFLNATTIAALDCSTASGALSFNNNLTVNGRMLMGLATGTMAYPVTLAGAAGPYDLQLRGGSYFDFSNTISITSGSYRLQMGCQLSGGISLVSGTFDTNGYSFTGGFFTSSNTNVRTLVMGYNLWTFTGNNRTVWDISTSTNLTVDTANPPITISNTSGTASFYGGSKTYKSLTIAGSTPATTIYGSNTFVSLSTTTSAGTTLTFQSGTTTTFNQFLVSGSSSKTITLRSTTPGSQSTLAFYNGNINCDYMDIKDSATTGTSLWYAGVNSTNSGNNSGWIFGAGSTGSMLGLLWA